MSSPSLACMLLTATGQPLVVYERDTSLPLQYGRLALLLASLLQFAAGRSEFARLDLSNGLAVVLSFDVSASIACAVVVAACGERQFELARFHSHIVLHEFVRQHRERLQCVVEADREESKRMTEDYTLTTALSNNSSGLGAAMDSSATMEEFVAFQHTVVASTLRKGENWTLLAIPNDIKLMRCALVNAETGVVVSETIASADFAVNFAYQNLVQRGQRALSAAFPVIVDMFLNGSRDGSIARDVACALVLQVETQSFPVYVAIQMLQFGTFAVVTHYSDHTSCFRASGCKLLRDGELQSRLSSGPQGSELSRLIHESESSKSFSLHVGHDGIPVSLACVMEGIANSWVPKI